MKTQTGGELPTTTTTRKPSSKLLTSVNAQLLKDLNTYSCMSNIGNLNVLLIGERGSGKSSLLSTFHRALHGNYGEPPIATVGNSRACSFTTHKRGFYLNTCRTIKGFDTRGLETLSSKELEQVRAIGDGKVSDNVQIIQKNFSDWTMWDVISALLKRNPAAILDDSCLRSNPKDVSITDIPHCVIFVIPANQRRVPKELRNFIDLFIEYGYHPLFAVTKIDLHGAEEGDLYAATHLYDCKKEELLSLFNIGYEQVKPIQNYTRWDLRELSVENLALDLLLRASQVAESFVHGRILKEEEATIDWDDVFSCQLM